MYWGFSWEPWSGAAPKLVVWDYLITGPTLILITHIHKNATLTHKLYLDSFTQLRQVR